MKPKEPELCSFPFCAHTPGRRSFRGARPALRAGSFFISSAIGMPRRKCFVTIRYHVSISKDGCGNGPRISTKVFDRQRSIQNRHKRNGEADRGEYRDSRRPGAGRREERSFLPETRCPKPDSRFSSDCGAAPFTGSDPIDIGKIQHEDLAVADLARAGAPGDGLDGSGRRNPR